MLAIGNCRSSTGIVHKVTVMAHQSYSCFGVCQGNRPTFWSGPVRGRNASVDAAIIEQDVWQLCNGGVHAVLCVQQPGVNPSVLEVEKLFQSYFEEAGVHFSCQRGRCYLWRHQSLHLMSQCSPQQQEHEFCHMSPCEKALYT